VLRKNVDYESICKLGPQLANVWNLNEDMHLTSSFIRFWKMDVVWPDES